MTPANAVAATTMSAMPDQISGDTGHHAKAAAAEGSKSAAGSGSGSANKASRLNTFVAPSPNRMLIRALDPVNRVLCLGGVPRLRDAPLLRAIPGIKGLTDVVKIDVPAEDMARLERTVNDRTAAFLTPNHPEFFTDWMLDKEIMSRIAPMAACWATHSVVNGMGALAQWFWLKNNLVAQIPGAGGAAGKAYSVDAAMKGRAVLLHPEGGVGWHGDTVAPLFPGAIEMALEAANRAKATGEQRRVYLVPIVWKLKFVKDVEPQLASEMGYVERKLGLMAPRLGSTLVERLSAVYTAMLARDEAAWGLLSGRGLPYDQRRLAALAAMHMKLQERLAIDGEQSVDGLLRLADRWLRADEAQPAPAVAEVRRLSADMRRLLRFWPALYPATELTQEQIAESIKRLRNDYCSGSWRDAVNRFVPRPAGSRIAYVRVPEAIDVTQWLQASTNSGPEQAAAGPLERDGVATLTQYLRGRMQAGIDAINIEIEGRGGVIRYPNPFTVA